LCKLELDEFETNEYNKTLFFVLIPQQLENKSKPTLIMKSIATRTLLLNDPLFSDENSHLEDLMDLSTQVEYKLDLDFIEEVKVLNYFIFVFIF
jgi:hypothetical protein